MSWHLKGTYFETCSCELMCPCNFSFDHGATYDYCRVSVDVPQSRLSRKGFALASGSETRSTSRSKTSFGSVSRPASPPG